MEICFSVVLIAVLPLIRGTIYVFGFYRSIKDISYEQHYKEAVHI